MGKCSQVKLSAAQRYYQKNKEYWRKRYRDNKEHYAEIKRRFRKNSPEKFKVIHKRSNWKTYLKRTYGLSPEEYEKLLQEQGGVCYTCKSPPARGRRLCLDHNHKTGEVRRFLCIRCNNLVGFLEHRNAKLIRALKRYLEEFS